MSHVFCHKLSLYPRSVLLTAVACIISILPRLAFSETPYSPAIAEASKEGEQAIQLAFHEPGSDRRPREAERGLHVDLVAFAPSP